MEFLTLESLISLIIVFVSWLLVVFLLTAKTKNKTSNILLSLFLIVNAQDSSGLFAHYFVYPSYPGWGMIINSTVFIKLPLLYLYLLSVIYSDFRFKAKHLWHLLPWILNILVLFPRFFAVDFESKWDFINANSLERYPEIKISYIFLHVQILIYLIMSFKVIKNYKTLLLENYSNASLFNHKWLFQLILIFAIDALLATFKNVFMFMHLEQIYKYTLLLTGLLALGLICWMVLKALHSPELFRGIDSNLQLVKELVDEHDISIDSKSLNSKIETEKTVKLKEYMLEEEPFLDASLSIDNLSKQINFPTKELSILINHDLNQHFFDFINGYRIQKAMEILNDSDKKGLTILEILYKVGFNSKSSFNTAFKKYTSLTPTQYRETALKSAT